MRRLIPLLLIIIFCVPAVSGAEGDALTFIAAPDALRPGKIYGIGVNVPAEGTLSVMLADQQGQVVYDIYTDFPVTPGENTIHWDGLRADFSVIESGEYMLQLLMEGYATETPLRLGAPYPLITSVRQSDGTFIDRPIEIGFEISVDGTVDVDLISMARGTTQRVASIPAQSGDNAFQWDGTAGGSRVDNGQYALVLTLRTDNGMESMAHRIALDVGTAEPEETAGIVMTAEETEAATEAETVMEMATQAEATDATEAEPETEPATEAPPQLSPPYSSVSDGTYWAMTPGEVDDAKIWAIMTQPITIYKDVDQKEHVYLMENPDGTGAQVAQVHGQSQGLHVIGETNEHGYVLVEVFSSYDDVYTPKTDEEKAHALELKQGYVKASGLKTIDVQQDMGLLIDKKTQRMYLFKNGERVTEFLISTGLIVDGKYHYESTVGEFITVSHSGGFYSNKYMYCDMAIRINGGILLHEVPYEPLGDGTKNYKPYEPLLGTKASHSCIRIQRQKNEDGYNHRWLWENLSHGKPYKVLVWDDLNRYDTPTTWYPNS